MCNFSASGCAKTGDSWLCRVSEGAGSSQTAESSSGSACFALHALDDLPIITLNL